MVEQWSVADQVSLDGRLSVWGAVCPPRVPYGDAPARSQLEREAWVLNRFLMRLGAARMLQFPLHIKKGHEPHGSDFVVYTGESRRGIQITDACDPKEQKQWSTVAKQVRDAGVDSEWKPNHVAQNLTAGNRYVGLVSDAIARKSEKVADGVTDLLVNLDTHDIAHDNLARQVEKLAHLSCFGFKFHRVWVLSSDGLIDLTNQTEVLEYKAPHL